MSKKIWDTYDADTQAILTEAAKAFGEEEKKINRQAAADNLQSCIDDYGMEVTYLTDDAKAEFVAKTAHIQDMIAKVKHKTYFKRSFLTILARRLPGQYPKI